MGLHLYCGNLPSSPAKAEHLGPAALSSRSAWTLSYQSCRNQLGDRRRYGLTAETHGFRKLRPGNLAAEADLVDDPRQVQLAYQSGGRIARMRISSALHTQRIYRY